MLKNNNSYCDKCTQYKKIIIKKEKKEEEDGDNKYDDYCRVLGEKDL